jgi:uncharacterized lipoprotein YddW (UPF0748 family)
MASWYRIAVALIVFLPQVQSQYLTTATTAPPKREFRGAWIATVSNIDWPLSLADSSNVAKQKSDLAAILDSLQNARINAVMFQIRSSCDAMYESSIEPWSQWLTGTQGKRPEPFYDPLQFIIEQCRRRGMEIHAWFNPYRAVIHSNSASIAVNHVSNTKPHLIRDYFTQGQTGLIPIKVLDPGEPETITYVLSVIMDVVRRYDIDGVHFDDYFYPYPVSGVSFPDSETYARYGGGMSLDHWRRENVNRLVRAVYDSIQVVKPRVKFGISPFGIWRNSIANGGAGTNGLESYSAIYADSRRWIAEGKVDYLAPQLYWNFNDTRAPYGTLAQWWNVNTFNRHMYIGHAVHNTAGSANWPVKEIVNQVAYNRDLLGVKGSIHFSARYFRLNTKTLNDSLRRTVYTARALVPPMNWDGRDNLPPNRPDNVTVRPLSSSFFILSWNKPTLASDGDEPTRYIIYRSTSFPIDIGDPRNFFEFRSDTFHIVPYPPQGTSITYAYTVTALDRNHNESLRSSTVIVDANRNVIVGVERDVVPELFVLRQNFPNPFSAGGGSAFGGNAATVIQFSIPFETRATLRVFDLLGREVAVLVDGVVRQGEHQVEFDARDVASGMYFYRLVAGGQVLVKRMQVLK